MYVFFIRRFPDLDHMFPIIYRMAQKGMPVTVLCQNLDYNIADDFMLAALKEEFGIEAQYTYHVDRSLLRRSSSSILMAARRLYPRAGMRVVPRIHRLLYGEKWAESLLAHFGASAIVLDFVKASNYSTRIITETAKRKGIPIVLIAHSTPMGFADLANKDQAVLPVADYMVVPNRMTVDFYKREGDTEQTFKILGSPRYCDEWEGAYNRLLADRFPCPDLPDEKGKLKVLFFERPRIGFSGNHEVVREVASLDFVSAVFNERLDKKSPYYKSAGSNYPSARLVQWADVVVMSISSIALEVLSQKKALIYLKYLAPDDACVFDQYGACWSVHSKQELLEALKTLHRNPDYRPYSLESVDALFGDIVYAGDRSRDVVDEHIKLILDVEREKPRARQGK
jgi:hypothetical protein